MSNSRRFCLVVPCGGPEGGGGGGGGRACGEDAREDEAEALGWGVLGKEVEVRGMGMERVKVVDCFGMTAGGGREDERRGWFTGLRKSERQRLGRRTFDL